MITVLIADDHPLVRSGIAGFLRAQPDLEVVAEASTGAEAVELAQRHRPDVALIDLQMPGGDGVDAIRRIATSVPHSWRCCGWLPRGCPTPTSLTGW